MATKRRPLNLFMLLILGLAGGGLLAAYVKYTPANKVPPAEHRQEPGVQRPAPEQLKSGQVAHADYKDNDLTITKQDVKVPEGADPKQFLIWESLKRTGAMPAEAKLLGVDVKDGVAILNFNQAFAQSYGSLQEGKILNSVMETVKTNFPDIKKVQFESEGQPIETLGNVDLSQPLDVNAPLAEG